MPAPPDPNSTSWPRPYLLSIYAEAIRHGYIWINDLPDAAAATGLRMAIYRTRRRSDSTNKNIITPEHHLVTVGPYDPVLRRMPVMFNKLPDDAPLPRLSTADGALIEVRPILLTDFAPPEDLVAPAAPVVLTSVVPIAASEVEVVIPDFVAEMVAKVRKESEQ